MWRRRRITGDLVILKSSPCLSPQPQRYVLCVCCACVCQKGVTLLANTEGCFPAQVAFMTHTIHHCSLFFTPFRSECACLRACVRTCVCARMPRVTESCMMFKASRSMKHICLSVCTNVCVCIVCCVLSEEQLRTLTVSCGRRGT